MKYLGLENIALPLKFLKGKLVKEDADEDKDNSSEDVIESFFTMENTYYHTRDYTLFGNFRPISKFLNSKDDEQ